MDLFVLRYDFNVNFGLICDWSSKRKKPNCILLLFRHETNSR